MRLGLLVCRRNEPAICASIDIPQWVIDAWDIRKKYINQGELIAGVVLPKAFADVIAGRDIIWFLDNTAAVAALIKAASPIEDNSSMALLAALAFMSAGARVWFEYVNTKQNPADALSRGGFDDPEVIDKIRSKQWVPRQVNFNWKVMEGLSPPAAWEQMTALGGVLW